MANSEADNLSVSFRKTMQLPDFCFSHDRVRKTKFAPASQIATTRERKKHLRQKVLDPGLQAAQATSDANFTCQLDWAMLCSNIWPTTLLGVPVKMLLDENDI